MPGYAYALTEDKNRWCLDYGIEISAYPSEDQRLDLWTHNKAIQKAVESRRIPLGMKQLLRGLRSRS